MRDHAVAVTKVSNAKADKANPLQVGAPLQGMLSKVLVKSGQAAPKNTPLFAIEAMKMETTNTAPQDVVVASITLAEGSRVQADDLVLTLE